MAAATAVAVYALLRLPVFGLPAAAALRRRGALCGASGGLVVRVSGFVGPGDADAGTLDGAGGIWLAAGGALAGGCGGGLRSGDIQQGTSRGCAPATTGGGSDGRCSGPAWLAAPLRAARRCFSGLRADTLPPLRRFGIGARRLGAGGMVAGLCAPGDSDANGRAAVRTHARHLVITRASGGGCGHAGAAGCAHRAAGPPRSGWHGSFSACCPPPTCSARKRLTTSVGCTCPHSQSSSARRAPR